MSFIMDRVGKIVKSAENMNYIPHQITIESSPSESKIIVEGNELTNFCTNNYLNLANDSRVIEAKIEATKKYGVGSGAARWMAGNHILHMKLEEKIAVFKGCEAATIFSSGTLANNGAIKALLDPVLLPVLVKNKAIDLSEDEKNFKIVIVLDQMNHASIFDACNDASKNAKEVNMIRVYRHLIVEKLQRILETKSKAGYKFMVIVDGVFSTLGTIVDLPAIIRIVQQYDACLMIDDAHGLGTIGKNGKGTAEYFNVDVNKIDINMGTFSKAVGVEGGYVAGSKILAKFLKENSKKYIFNTSMPPDNCAAIIKSLEIIEKEPERRKQLMDNAKLLRRGLNSIGYNTLGSQTQIVPILIGDEAITKKMFPEILDKGFFVRAFIYPASPLGHAIFRANVMSSHKKEDIEKFIDIMEELGKKYSVINE